MSKGHRDRCMCAHRYVLLFSWFNEMEKNNNNWGRLWQYYEFTDKITACTYKKCLGSGILIKGKRKLLYDSET